MNDLKALVRRWFDEVWTKGNAHVIDEMVGDAVESHGLSEAPMLSAKHFRVFYDMYRGAFPDIRATVKECIQEDDKTACRVVFNARHTGDHLGFPATGREVEFEAIILVTWRQGKIVAAQNQFDQLGLLRQLGQESKTMTVK